MASTIKAKTTSGNGGAATRAPKQLQQQPGGTAIAPMPGTLTKRDLTSLASQWRRSTEAHEALGRTLARLGVETGISPA